MEDTSASIRQMKEVGLADPSKMMDGSEYLSGRTASLTEETTASGECSTMFYSCVEEQIEQSKTHWSILAEPGSNDDDEQLRHRRNWRKFIPCCSSDEEKGVAEVSNVEVFKALQSHPTWGTFFRKFNEGGGRATLEVGEKFAEGGQAELYHAKVTWANPAKTQVDLEAGHEWVLKVFKKGTFLRHLQAQLPQGLLRNHAEELENWKSSTPKVYPRYYSAIYRGTLLADGRFAFLMLKEHFDLRTMIERNMKLRSGEDDCGPFSKEDAEYIMFCIALGVDWLHCRDIVHRDLKASNVLISECKNNYPKWFLSVADYECSIGVVGTGFFRAPEILQALKEQRLSQKLEVFSKAADIYSFGMTCYEILTGKLPFEGHPQNDYDFVISGQCPMVPKYVEDWTRELLRRCWESNPKGRPEIGEILKLFSTNSMEAKKFEERLEEQFGKNFKMKHDIDISNS